jgi:hypothetical protein
MTLRIKYKPVNVITGNVIILLMDQIDKFHATCLKLLYIKQFAYCYQFAPKMHKEP